MITTLGQFCQLCMIIAKHPSSVFLCTGTLGTYRDRQTVHLVILVHYIDVVNMFLLSNNFGIVPVADPYHALVVENCCARKSGASRALLTLRPMLSFEHVSSKPAKTPSPLPSYTHI